MIESKLLIGSRDYYSCDLTQEIPIRVSILTINGPEGFAILTSLNGEESSLQEYIRRLKESESITEVEVTFRSPKVYWTRVIHNLNTPSIHETVLESGNMSLFPIEIERGLQMHTILSPSPDSFRELMRLMRKRFTTVRMEWLSSKPDESPQMLLTLKQFEAIRLAFRSGYYEVPRRTKILDLAQTLGIGRVAMQERLRRAELRILAHYAKNF